MANIECLDANFWRILFRVIHISTILQVPVWKCTVRHHTYGAGTSLPGTRTSRFTNYPCVRCLRLAQSTLTDSTRVQAQKIAHSLQLAGAGVGAAVQDQHINAANQTNSSANEMTALRIYDTSATNKAIALLHFAATGGHTAAQLALGVR